MKKHGLAAFLFTTVLTFQAQAASYIGASTGTTNGAAGVIAMSALCNATFAGARMCTYEEIALTVHKSAKSHGPAWVQPLDSSGHPVPTVCAGLGSGGGISALVVDGKGRWNAGAGALCDSVLPVSCCK